MTVIHTDRFKRARENERAREMEERAEQHALRTQCCEMVLTGGDPEYDTHICLRKKDHKGYHMDKITGFSWKWETPNDHH